MYILIGLHLNAFVNDVIGDEDCDEKINSNKLAIKDCEEEVTVAMEKS
jgi:hypothetical protein